MHKVLVIGRGGREHTLAWKFSKSKQVSQVFVAPGSKGMEDVATTVPIDENDFDALIAFAKKEDIALTVVGPEVPLVNGIVDQFMQAGLPVWGPKANAAIIEGSKSFAKDLMKKYNIPTAAYETFTDYEAARQYIESAPMPTVIKADGLAAGKGVVIANTQAEALDALKEMMKESRFGKASQTVVVEEFLEGEEFSFIAFAAGDTVCPMALSQDHKRAYDRDEGPNTGGMGAYSPVPQISNASGDMIKRAIDKILIPTAKAMTAEGRPFTGFLYAGLIATKQGPKVIEFNARLGDPETEVLLPRLENDLFEVMMHMLNGNPIDLHWSDDAVVGVVLSSKGYPDSYKTGFPIHGLDTLKEDTMVFHCGTGYQDGQFVTNGGRVLFIARKAKDIAIAQKEVYEEIKKIQCDNLFYRTDIGYRALV
ncbi:MAG: phosphoribosylamine--glycine ligase [Defluviitaleaceae bacterium]|nr:phosphoribosylamine--glycine ligase [Defluviitaleaceae bacterium]